MPPGRHTRLTSERHTISNIRSSVTHTHRERHHRSRHSSHTQRRHKHQRKRLVSRHDTLSEDDAEKVPSQQSVKAYVDTQIAGLGSSMVFLGSYDANTTDPTDGDVGGTYVVTVAGTGVASFWTTALEVGDVIIQENATATTEADWVVVSRDIIPASATVAGVVELATQAEVNTGTDTTRVVTPDTLSNYSGFPTGTPEGTAILSTAETVGKLLQADGDNTCSWVAAPSGTPEGTAILSTGETGGTKYLREDGDGTCSWQTVTGGSGDFLADGSVAMTGELDLGANSIGGTAQSITGDGTTTIDWGAGNFVNFTFANLTAETFTFTAPSNPGELVVKTLYDGDTGQTATWPASVKWVGGTAPTLSDSVTNGVDIIRFYYDGTNYYGTFDLNFS